MSGSRRRSSTGGEGLPDPEIDIVKTSYFVRPTVSGGPHMDALLYNQATIMKMLQDIRNVQALGITLEGSKSSNRQKPTSEVADIMANEEMAERLASVALQWVAAAPANKMAKTHANKNLSVVANATFDAFKAALEHLWDQDVFENETEGNLVAMMKVIEASEVKKEDLHIAVAKRLAANEDTTGATEVEEPSGRAAGPSGEVEEEAETGGRGKGSSGGRRGGSRGGNRGGRGPSRSRARGRGRGSGNTTPTVTETTSTGGDVGGRARKRPRIEDSDDEQNDSDDGAIDPAII